MVEQRLGERRTFGRIGARAELVQQHQRPRPGRLHDPDDRAKVAGEGRQRLRDRLLVADVGEDVTPDRQPAAGRRRDVQARLVHDAEQAQGPQGHRLAAGVRAGHDQGRVAVAEPDVDRDDLAGQARVPGGQQHDLESLGGPGTGSAHVRRERCLCRPEIEMSQAAQRVTQVHGVRGDERGQLIEDPGDLLGLGDLGLAPGVPELDRDERLDEQRLAAARRVVDDPLDPRPRLGLDRHHVAPVAQRDDRLLEGAPELGPDERIEPATKAVVGDPDRRPQATEARRGGIEQLADRVEAAGQGRAQRRQRMQVLADLAQEWPPLVCEQRGEARGGVERVGDLQELGRLQAPAPCRTLDRGTDVVRAADSEPGPLLEQGEHLIRLVESAGHDDPVARRLERLGELARWRERRGFGEPGPDGRELEQDDRALVHGDRSAGGARPGDRRVAREGEAPGPVGPRLPGVADADPCCRPDRVSPLRLTGRWDLQTQCRSPVAQVGAGPAGVEPERRGDQARSAGEPPVRNPGDSRGVGDGLLRCADPSVGRRTGDPVGAHPVDPVKRFDRPDEQGGR